MNKFCTMEGWDVFQVSVSLIPYFFIVGWWEACDFFEPNHASRDGLVVLFIDFLNSKVISFNAAIYFQSYVIMKSQKSGMIVRIGKVLPHNKGKSGTQRNSQGGILSSLQQKQVFVRSIAGMLKYLRVNYPYYWYFTRIEESIMTDREVKVQLRSFY